MLCYYAAPLSPSVQPGLIFASWGECGKDRLKGWDLPPSFPHGVRDSEPLPSYKRLGLADWIVSLSANIFNIFNIYINYEQQNGCKIFLDLIRQSSPFVKAETWSMKVGGIYLLASGGGGGTRKSRIGNDEWRTCALWQPKPCCHLGNKLHRIREICVREFEKHTLENIENKLKECEKCILDTNTL